MPSYSSTPNQNGLYKSLVYCMRHPDDWITIDQDYFTRAYRIQLGTRVGGTVIQDDLLVLMEDLSYASRLADLNARVEKFFRDAAGARMNSRGAFGEITPIPTHIVHQKAVEAIAEVAPSMVPTKIVSESVRQVAEKKETVKQDDSDTVVVTQKKRRRVRLE